LGAKSGRKGLSWTK